MAHGSHHDHDNRPHSHQHGDDAALAGMLDLDAEVLGEQLAELTARLAALAGDAPVRRILDLGCGPGTGTLALLRRFPGAEVVAVDRSPQMLRHLRDRLAPLGLAARVRTVEADLDAPWPDLGGPVDLVWTSAALHHLADPAVALARVREALRPGGVLAVIETDGVPHVLPVDDSVPAGLEERCRALTAQRHSAEVPHLGADWGAPLGDAGFAVEAAEEIGAQLGAPLPEAAARYAAELLRRLRGSVGDRLDPADRAALDALQADGGERLTLRTVRPVWLARRPLATG